MTIKYINSLKIYKYNLKYAIYNNYILCLILYARIFNENVTRTEQITLNLMQDIKIHFSEKHTRKYIYFVYLRI